jgi:hypothetical protein
MQFNAPRRKIGRRSRQARPRPAIRRSDNISAMQRIVRPPPGTTHISIPGEVLTFDVGTSAAVAFSVDSQTLFAASAYANMTGIYKYYRIKRITLRVYLPDAITTTSGTFVSTLQYVQPSTTPTAILYNNILDLRPNRQTKAWQSHSWIWTPHKPSDFDFKLISDTTNYATLYCANGLSAATVTTPTRFLLRFVAQVELYGLFNLTRTITDYDEEQDHGFAQMHNDLQPSL